MINYQPLTRQLLLFASVIFISISCHDNTLEEDLELVDRDMIAATKLVEEYLSVTKGRGNAEASITVLKYQNGKLLFLSNTDDNFGYTELNEESVTATVESGDYVFWFSGGGVSDLDGIEFDEESQRKLMDSPSEVFSNKLWVIEIEEEESDDDDDEDDDRFLKYDIIYQFKGNNGPPIRLDPKIKIQD